MVMPAALDPLARFWYNQRTVKSKIHPKWFADAQVTCACGSTFTTGSTMQKIGVEVCSNCHPLYTGQQKFLDTAGRVDKFNQRVAQAQVKQAEAKARKDKKAAEEAVPAAV
jgi:large subunit ribosomal protein L31